MNDSNDEVQKELRRLTYLTNVEKICGKTWPEVAAEFEAEMAEIKRLENAGRTTTRNRRES